MQLRAALVWGALAVGCGCGADRGGGAQTTPPATSDTPVATTPEATPAASAAAPSPATAPRDAQAEAQAAPKPWPPSQPEAIDTPWCSDAVRALDEETCIVLPDQPSTTLLVYLHGIVPPGQTSPQLENFEKVVASASLEAGVVALIPRGDQGLAPAKYKGWWGWPTGLPSYRAHTEKLLARLESKQQKLENLLGVKMRRRYLAGSSAGAYYAALLALHGAYPADGYGAMSGGAGVRTEALAKLPPKPFYVGFGKHDSVGASARALGQLLEKAGWPVKIAAHDVGHGARKVYIDEAFVFWREALAE